MRKVDDVLSNVHFVFQRRSDVDRGISNRERVGWVGTSIRNTWLTRRLVRNPVAEETTAPSGHPYGGCLS